MGARGFWRRVKRDYGPYLALSPYLFVVLFPFYWMVITAFKRDRDLYNLETAPFWFKEPPTLEHVKLLLEGTLFPTWLGNSLMIGALVVFITLVLALPAAYALARIRFPGAQPLSTVPCTSGFQLASCTTRKGNAKSNCRRQSSNSICNWGW